MDIKRSYLSMIRAFPGGWDAISAALGYTRDSLENRIYERKGQSVLVETAIQMQKFSGTTHFAEAVAQESGGVFIQLPVHSDADDEELLAKFNDLYGRLGEFSTKFKESVADDEVDGKERADLEHIGQQIHKTTAELLGLTFRIYCRDGAGK